MLNCIQPQGLNESDLFLASTGLLGVTADKSVLTSSFLCSACKFSNLCQCCVMLVTAIHSDEGSLCVVLDLFHHEENVF